MGPTFTCWKWKSYLHFCLLCRVPSTTRHLLCIYVSPPLTNPIFVLSTSWLVPQEPNFLSEGKCSFLVWRAVSRLNAFERRLVLGKGVLGEGGLHISSSCLHCNLEQHGLDVCVSKNLDFTYWPGWGGVISDSCGGTTGKHKQYSLPAYAKHSLPIPGLKTGYGPKTRVSSSLVKLRQPGSGWSMEWKLVKSGNFYKIGPIPMLAEFC